jgi:hypothetical protein
MVGSPERLLICATKVPNCCFGLEVHDQQLVAFQQRLQTGAADALGRFGRLQPDTGGRREALPTTAVPSSCA